MGIISTFFNSLINPIEETVKTVISNYRLSSNNLKEVAFNRLITAKKLNNPNIAYIASLANEEFLKSINNDVALFIFILMMCESDKHNKDFSKNPNFYFLKIETAVIKRLHTYIPDRDINYFLANHFASKYNRFRW